MPASQRAADQALRDGIRAGAVLRSREAAVGTVETMQAMRADNCAITPEMAAAENEALALLESAEAGARKHGRPTGRWRPSNVERMTTADVMDAASYAARVTARIIARQAPKLTDDEYADLQSDLVIAALERGRAHEGDTFPGLPLWRALDPKVDREREAAISRAYMSASNGADMAAAEASAHAALLAEGALRNAWRAYLTAHGRTFARERVEAHKAKRAAEAEAASPQATLAERVAVSHAEAKELAYDLRVALDLNAREVEAATAALDGLTHRERASLTPGLTPANVAKRVQRGTADLADRLGDPWAVRDAVALALAEQAGREAMPEDAKAAQREDALRSMIEARPVDFPAAHRLPHNAPDWRTNCKPSPVHVHHVSTVAQPA